MIERGVEADLDAIEQLYNEVNDALERGVNYPGWKKGVYPTRQDAADGILAQTLFIARRGGVVVGSMILNHIPENSYDRVTWQYDGDYSRVLVVHTLAVHPARLQSGVGRALLAFADRFGRQNAVKSIRLDVFEDNMPAVRLYESCGYQYVARVDLGLKRAGLNWFKLYEKLL